MNAEELLAMLEDYYAQRSLLEMSRDEMMARVVIPEDVVKLQKSVAQRKWQVQANAQEVVAEIRNEMQEALARVVIPEEIKVALAAIDAERQRIREAADIEIEIKRSAAEQLLSNIDVEAGQQVVGVMSEINARRRDIEEEFSTKARAVDQNIEALKKRVQEAVALTGKSLKGKMLNAVYSPGKITWNTDKLEGMMALIPEIKQARKEGQPSVAIRPIVGK